MSTLVLSLCLPYLGVKELERAGAINRHFRKLVEAERVKIMHRRAENAWTVARKWCKSEAPSVFDSLLEGVTEDDLDDAERYLCVRLPQAYRSILLFQNGQRNMKDEGHLFYGLFGGHIYYDVGVSTRLLPLQLVVQLTLAERQEGILSATEVIIASDTLFGPTENIVLRRQDDARRPNRFFWLETTTGQVFVNGRHRLVDGKSAFLSVSDDKGYLEDSIEPCTRYVPSGPLTDILLKGRKADRSNTMDSVLRWFEEYVHRLQTGMYRAERLYKPSDRTFGISIFPQWGDDMSCCCTNGVEVKASVVFIPEDSTRTQRMRRRLGINPMLYMFAYQIEFRLLSEAKQRERGIAEPSTTVQLKGRYWKIFNSDEHCKEVNGDAVVGHYPLLEAGGAPFSYSSVTDCDKLPGRMEGFFTFVQGSIETPTSEPFRVYCSEFPLAQPSFIF